MAENIRLENPERLQVSQALWAKAREYRQHSKTMMQLHKAGGNGVITSKAAKRMAKNHDDLAKEHEELATQFEAYSTITLSDPLPG